jgi:hypothetical protein
MHRASRFEFLAGVEGSHGAEARHPADQHLAHETAGGHDLRIG